jgi:hypothetical protein
MWLQVELLRTIVTCTRKGLKKYKLTSHCLKQSLRLQFSFYFHYFLRINR